MCNPVISTPSPLIMTRRRGLLLRSSVETNSQEKEEEELMKLSTASTPCESQDNSLLKPSNRLGSEETLSTWCSSRSLFSNFSEEEEDEDDDLQQDDQQDSSYSKEEEEEEEEEIVLLQKKKRPRALSLPTAPRNFANELEAARRSSCPTLTLTNFVERSTRHDIYDLRDYVAEDDCPVTCLQFHETTQGTGFRRWSYKRDNVDHHIAQLCETQGIDWQMNIRLTINVDDDDLSLDSVLSLLDRVAGDTSITSLEMTGHVSASDQTTILQRLSTLLHKNDRVWQQVNIVTGHLPSSSAEDDDCSQWQATIMEYMGIFSQLYMQYNLPIDIRPMTV